MIRKLGTTSKRSDGRVGSTRAVVGALAFFGVAIAGAALATRIVFAQEVITDANVPRPRLVNAQPPVEQTGPELVSTRAPAPSNVVPFTVASIDVIVIVPEPAVAEVTSTVHEPAAVVQDDAGSAVPPPTHV